MKTPFRYELKFVLDETERNYFYSWIKQNTDFKKNYKNRIINSIYLDDTEFTSAKNNLIGLSRRKKFRFRWYDNNYENNINFEIKNKKDRLSYKNIFYFKDINKNSLKKIYNFTKYIITEIEKKENIFFDNHIYPVLNVNYKREYYENSRKIRITIDSNIYFSETNIFNNNILKNASHYPKYIIEFKFDPKEKNEVSKILKQISLYPRRQSKYLLGLSVTGRAIYI